MKTAFFLYDLAEGMEGDGKARLYQLSYTVSLHRHPVQWKHTPASTPGMCC